MKVRIGCCGWQYDDWVGPFYPPEARNRRAGWLEHYGRFFDSVEIDSTHYSVPGRRTVDAWVQKGRRIGNFEFSLKVHQEVTHGRLVALDAAGAAALARDFERDVLAPLDDARLLGAVLLQLSPHFRRVDDARGSSQAVLRDFLGGLDTGRYRYVVEFRHESWLDAGRREIHPGALDILRERKVAVCVLDSPGFPVTSAQTADTAYIRFHGQNRDIWFSREKPGGDTRLNRYDYLYSEEELGPWVDRVEDIERRCREVRIAFNNHGHAKAVRNALVFRRMLGGDAGGKETRMPERVTLDSF
ncbi:MAG: DUF72 domain-containing protein [Euryarchaeota archaeon]|nr:DUF72 domain-containing protein [Euryarchaeota archaeon]